MMLWLALLAVALVILAPWLRARYDHATTYKRWLREEMRPFIEEHMREMDSK